MSQRSIDTIEKRIKSLEENYKKAREKCDELELKLLNLHKEKEKIQCEMILKALKKSGKTFRQVMTFLGC